MHEMSIAMSVVEQVEEAAEAAEAAGAQCAGAVESVRLQVGELAGVVPDALRFCFELACAGTVLDGAELTFDPVPGRARCAPCSREWDTGMPPDLCCPDCDGAAAELVSGRELRITEVRWAHRAVPVHVHEKE
jgi:hydrogenase nickel incorporation protein HypA/HybF